MIKTQCWLVITIQCVNIDRVWKLTFLQCRHIAMIQNINLPFLISKENSQFLKLFYYFLKDIKQISYKKY